MSAPSQPPLTPPPGNQPPAAPAYGQNAPDQKPAGPDTYNVLAIVSFVSAFFIQLVAVICGHIALSQIKKTGEKGRGLAIAGLVIGYLGILAGIIAFLILIPVFIGIMNDPSLIDRYNQY